MIGYTIYKFCLSIASFNHSITAMNNIDVHDRCVHQTVHFLMLSNIFVSRLNVNLHMVKLNTRAENVKKQRHFITLLN